MLFRNVSPVKIDDVILYGKIEDIIDLLPNDHFNLIVTSPPYNLGKDYETKQSLDAYLETQKEVISLLVQDKLKDTGSICWQVGNFVDKGEVYPLDIYFYHIFKSLGLKLKNRIIWRFNHGLHATKRLSGRYETLLWFSKTDRYVFNLDAIRVRAKYPGKRHFKGNKKGQLSGNPKGKNPSDYWELLEKEHTTGVIDIPNVKANHPEKTDHPCQFPVELVERCVLAFTNPGDYVLDPFGGVGTTAIAAITHGRKAISVEKEKSYCTIAQKRLEQLFLGELKTRPVGKSIYQPTGKDKVSQIPMEWILEG